MESARQKVVVLLEGQGADELLAGYDHACFPAAIRDRIAGGQFGAAAAELGWQLRTRGPLDTLLWGGRALVPSAQRVLSGIRGEGGVYAGPLARAVPESVGRIDPAPPTRGHLNALLRHQHEAELGRLLHYGDAIAMAHSIESRLPFMDYRLVEYVFRLPGELKFRDGVGKALLRDAVRKDVPADILDNRKKLGFRTPIDRWFREAPEETLLPVLSSERCRKRGIFSQPALERVIARHRDGKVDLSHYLFRWVMTELWFEEFID
jgi:asparagine synthase (glutamine-hydrolysing)